MIEVGVDVPNATVMVIMDAERFGVSQLHQLRGRVGRGTAPGLCLLVTEAPPASPARDRLDAVAATLDGFKLSRLDLEQRREGDVLGAAQAGRQSSLKLLRLLADEDLIGQARQEATAVVSADPGLPAIPPCAPPSTTCSAPRPTTSIRPDVAGVHTGGMARVIAGESGRPSAGRPGGPRYPADQRPRQGRALRHDLLDRRAAGRGSGSLTFTPAPARSAWRPCPAAPAHVRWSSPALRAARHPGERGGARPARCRSRPRPGGAGVSREPPALEPYDVVFADPPYATPGEQIGAVLAALAAPGWLAPGALVIVERATRSGPFAWPDGFTSDRARRYGEATFWYGLARGLTSS